VDRVTILDGQRVLHDGEWRGEGETIEVDAYRAAVMIASDVAKAADEDKPTRRRKAPTK
jgi:hypothetical protein